GKARADLAQQGDAAFELDRVALAIVERHGLDDGEPVERPGEAGRRILPAREQHQRGACGAGRRIHVCAHVLPLPSAARVRGAGGDVLPLSQVGGYAMGARAATLRGVPTPLAVASTVTDVTLETVSQLAYTAVGLGLLARLHPSSAIIAPASFGLAGMALLV